MIRRIDPWDLPDVPALLEEVGRRVDVRAGLDVVAVVDTEPTRGLLAYEVLRPLARLSTGYEVWDLARHQLEQVFVRLCPQRRLGEPPHFTLHVVRFREGRVVPTPDEGALAYAMLLANNPVHGFVGEVITVTEHGWRERHRGDLAPTLTSLRRAQLRPA
jgi:hypothetical protein